MTPTVPPCPNRAPAPGARPGETNAETTNRAPRVCAYRHTGHGLGGPPPCYLRNSQKSPPVPRVCPWGES